MYPRAAILEAAKTLVLQSILDEIEDEDSEWTIPFGQSPENFCDTIMREAESDVLYIMGFILGSVSQAWGFDFSLVFYHAGFHEDDLSNVIFHLIMGCFGHGIFLGDDGPNGPMSTGLEQAASVLLGEFDLDFDLDGQSREFESIPVNFEQYSTLTDKIVIPFMVEKK